MANVEKISVAVTRRLKDDAVEELRRLWDAGVASGPPRDGEEAFERVRGQLRVRPAS